MRRDQVIVLTLPEWRGAVEASWIATLLRLKPSSSKGTYVQTIYLSSTMSPSVSIDKTTVAGL